MSDQTSELKNRSAAGRQLSSIGSVGVTGTVFFNASYKQTLTLICDPKSFQASPNNAEESSFNSW